MQMAKSFMRPQTVRRPFENAHANERPITDRRSRADFKVGGMSAVATAYINNNNNDININGRKNIINESNRECKSRPK
jgi:hypothetical protein